MLFKSKKEAQIKSLYAVAKGPRIGSFYLLISQIGPKYTFIELPDFISVVLDEKDVKLGIDEGILDLVKVLDQKTFDTTIKEYFGREKLNEHYSRQQQPST